MRGTANAAMEDTAHKIPFARTLRRNQTDVEQLLWKYLRNRRLNGVKFRRQHPIDTYIVDFVCVEKYLVVELDGGQHNSDKGRMYDKNRQKYLQEKGFRILRFWNNEVIEDIENVLRVIYDALTLPSPTGRGGKE